jgi:hypothetical protein
MILNNFEGRVAMSISQIPDQQLFVLDLKNLPVSKLIGIAGQVHDNTNSDSALIHGSDDHLVFEEAGLYFSTGATVLKVYYKPGLSAHGKMTFFGKTAEFKASVSKEGVVFKGYIDNFRIGDLVVQSASGAPQASIDIEMTSSTKRVKLDGMIKYCSFELVVLVDISINDKLPRFEAFFFLKLTEGLSFKLKAKADVADVKALAKSDVLFGAELEADIIGLIFDGITSAITSLQKLGDLTFEEMQNSLANQLSIEEAKLKRIEGKINDEKTNMGVERERRRRKINEEREKQKTQREKLEGLRKKVREAEGERNTEQERLEREVKMPKPDATRCLRRRDKSTTTDYEI